MLAAKLATNTDIINDTGKTDKFPFTQTESVPSLCGTIYYTESRVGKSFHR